ncbi:MAG TPA: ABC transporter permease, partial [Armatimonadota bacterium]
MRAYLRVVLQELKLIFSDRRIFTIMLIGPFFYGLIFGGVYYNGRVSQVSTMIVNQDHSALSKELINALNASDSIEITGYGESVEDFRDAVKKGTSYVCVVIPDGFERDIKKGKQAKVVALADASNILIANVT